MSDKKGKKGKPKPPSRELGSDQERDDDSISPSLNKDENVINLYAVYDANENLVQLKFEKNSSIPRVILKIIGLIIPLQIHLTSITINKGIDQYTIYEICKFLPMSHITEICLDNSFLKEANYYLLLEKPNLIRQLSLARCSITDEVLKTLADMLVYPLPSSKSLLILNLSSNRITDEGAKYFAEAIRSNRQLSYLNLADNMLTDCGAAAILDTLVSFPLSFNELLTSRFRHIAHLKQKNELIIQMARELRAGDFDKRSTKRKSPKPMATAAKKTKGLEKEISLKSMPESKSMINTDSAYMDKATIMAENVLGEFKDPFSKVETFVENGGVYSYGNNALCYLNFSYNNLSFTSVKKLRNVLEYQKNMDRKPRGLVNVSIEGNFLPLQCKELFSIDHMLESNLSLHQRKTSAHKKRPQSKPGKV